MSTETNATEKDEEIYRSPIAAPLTQRRLVVRLLGPGREEQGEEFRAEVPNTKLTFVVLRSDDITVDAMQGMGDQLHRKAPDREFIVLAIDPKDTIEFFEEI